MRMGSSTLRGKRMLGKPQDVTHLMFIIATAGAFAGLRSVATLSIIQGV